MAAEYRSPLCPHCGEPVGVEMVAEAKAQSRVTMTIAPHDGELLGAGVLGSKIEAFASLMGKAMEAEGEPGATLIDKITTDAHGAVSVTLLIMRRKPPPPNEIGAVGVIAA